MALGWNLIDLEISTTLDLDIGSARGSTLLNCKTQWYLFMPFLPAKQDKRQNKPLIYNLAWPY